MIQAFAVRAGHRWISLLPDSQRGARLAIEIEFPTRCATGAEQDELRYVTSPVCDLWEHNRRRRAAIHVRDRERGQEKIAALVRKRAHRESRERCRRPDVQHTCEFCRQSGNKLAGELRAMPLGLHRERALTGSNSGGAVTLKCLYRDIRIGLGEIGNGQTPCCAPLTDPHRREHG
jgi:hypothetical protein